MKLAIWLGAFSATSNVVFESGLLGSWNASEKAIVAVSSFVDLHKSPEKEEPKEEVDDDDDDDDVKEEVTAVNNVSEATLRRRRVAAAAAERRIKASSIKN